MATRGAGLRDFNRERVVAAVGDGARSRAALCSTTGLARSTVEGLVRDLLVDGVLAEERAPAPGRGRGRPPRRLQVAARPRTVLAVDLGHSHGQVALLRVEGTTAPAPADGGRARPTVTVLARESVLLDVDASPEAALDRAEALAHALMARAPGSAPTAGALGLPAPVDPRTGAVGTGNLLRRWVRRRPAAELSERLGLPFTLDNDANLGALAEATFGEARGVTDLIYVKVATGIGAGLLLGGRIHHGLDGRAGEIGHVPVDVAGPLCRCGNRGCLETVAAVPQVLAAFAGLAEAPRDMRGVAALLAQEDPGARRVVGDAGRLIGRPLADLVNALNPEQVVVGGQLAGAGEPLLEGIRESIDRFAQPGLTRGLQVRLSSFAGSAELLGAAALAAAQAESVRA